MPRLEDPQVRDALLGCARGHAGVGPVDRLVGLGGGLMARTNPSLAEALSPWSAPHDAAELLEGFRLSINALADEQHTGLPDSMRVLKVLHLRNDIELAALGGDWPAMGVRRLGGAWTLDARQFDLWAQGQVSVFRRRAEAAQPTVQMQSRMSLL
ncbi:hypothetical protein BLIG_00379 [Bifidobacterium longum subsp. infantis CCUG 52486]|uniref:Uncharacterized protein n=2 Tax=Bifidobacterium longum TaxID=216816 RepID=C5E8T5_BIFLI|nr:hypothetical protein BLIG_00379 [Bifidobacterium longum subsp. infantis CCUG 52486]RDX06594.1 hypothetical protein CE166_00755 [Bifidobacterium longum]RDX14118.1 hypothetical protein CE157_04730 [Bifidobacterium longum]